MWIPALSAIGAGFAIGLAAIGSGVGQAWPERLGFWAWGFGFRVYSCGVQGLGFRVWGFRVQGLGFRV